MRRQDRHATGLLYCEAELASSIIDEEIEFAATETRMRPSEYRESSLLAAVASIGLGLASDGLARDTLTVAQTGSADFSEIADAVNAAQDGDVIVVAFGSYLPFVIDGKGLTVVAPTGASMVTGVGSSGAQGALITIRNLAPQQRCVIEQLSLTNFTTAKATLYVADCAGPVWLQHLFVDSYNATGVAIERSAAVVVNDCDIQTNTVPCLPNGTPNPRPGTRIVDSRVTLHLSSTTGSHGNTVGFGFPTPTAPAPGGMGLEVIDSQVDLSACVVHGGSGNSMTLSGCFHGGNGGVGLVLGTAGGLGAPPQVRLRDVSLAGGNPGFFQVGCAPTPLPGIPSVVTAGQIQSLAAPARRLIADGVALVGTSFDLSLHGAPLDQALVFAGVPAPAIPLPGTLGAALHLAPASVLVVLQLPATGALPLEFVVPPLPPGAGAALAGVQFVALSSSGTVVESGPLAITVVP